MKKKGIINKQLAGNLAGLGQQDLVLLCNAKLMIPKDIEVVDLALTAQVPTIEQVLRAITEENSFEYYFIPEEFKEENSKTYQNVRELLKDAKEDMAANISFNSYVRNTKFAIRTGDMTKYANMILRAGDITEE